MTYAEIVSFHALAANSCLKSSIPMGWFHFLACPLSTSKVSICLCKECQFHSCIAHNGFEHLRILTQKIAIKTQIKSMLFQFLYDLAICYIRNTSKHEERWRIPTKYNLSVNCWQKIDFFKDHNSFSQFRRFTIVQPLPALCWKQSTALDSTQYTLIYDAYESH